MESSLKNKYKLMNLVKKFIFYILLLFGAFIMLMPFLWMISTSLKHSGATMVLPPEFIPKEPTLENYREVVNRFPMLRFLFNSLLVAALTTFGTIIFSSMAGYAFARLEFNWRDQLFLLYLATMMVPFQVTMIPQFILMQEIGWINTYQALIIPPIFDVFGTFLMRQAMLTVPRELEEAAFMDGANHLQVFLKVNLPLIKPTLATLTIFTFMGSWNNYLWPLIVISSEELSTLPLGLSLLQGRWSTDWNLMMAGVVISVIPIILVYLFAQKYFVKGLTMSGLKE